MQEFQDGEAKPDQEPTAQGFPLPQGPAPGSVPSSYGAPYEAANDQARETAFFAELDRRGIPMLDRPRKLVAGEVLTWIDSAVVVLVGVVLVAAGAVAGPGTLYEFGVAPSLAIPMGIGCLVQAIIQLIGAY